ncbi:MAG: hypothetical protein GY854_26740 [Deltaproteobacteria bacterium]|nr:hypothetical protein [Deltaproteobacteria bacterium]
MKNKFHWILLGLVGLVLGAGLAGCHRAQMRDYCEGERKCEGGNDADEKACVEYMKGERAAAKEYDCKSEYDDVLECWADKSSCKTEEIEDHDSYGLKKYTDDGACDGKVESLWRCVDGASGR